MTGIYNRNLPSIEGAPVGDAPRVLIVDDSAPLRAALAEAREDSAPLRAALAEAREEGGCTDRRTRRATMTGIYNRNLPSIEGAPVGDAPRVLIVDDSAPLRAALAEAREEGGCTIVGREGQR